MSWAKRLLDERLFRLFLTVAESFDKKRVENPDGTATVLRHPKKKQMFQSMWCPLHVKAYAQCGCGVRKNKPPRP